MELVMSLLIGALLMEGYAWLPRFSDFICELAVRRVHLADRDRCREEWKAALNELPNTIIKLVHAVCYFGAGSASALRGSAVDGCNALLPASLA